MVQPAAGFIPRALPEAVAVSTAASAAVGSMVAADSTVAADSMAAVVPPAVADTDNCRAMSDNPPCDMCGRTIPSGSAYLVKIEVYADPQLPPMSADEIAATDFNATLAGLMKQIDAMSADDLQDGVHRSFNYQLCPRCHSSYLTNPLGMPRRAPISTN
jgi:hypothetical protein